MQNPIHKRVYGLATSFRLLLVVLALAAAAVVAGRINLFPSADAAGVSRSLPATASPSARALQNVITQQQVLAKPGGLPDDHFGLVVAVSGDTAVIGAPVNQTNSPRTGQSVVFVRTGNVWSYQATLVANDADLQSLFGRSVAISGDTIVVGAPFNAAYRGAAYVFTRTGTVWTQQQKLTAGGGALDGQIGGSVGISGNTIVVGSYSDDNFAGSAYVFVRSGTTWTQQQRLTASDRIINAFFGVSVAIDGETIISGAPYRNPKGAAYVFTRAGATWTEQQKLTPSDGENGDGLGYSVAISGDTVLADNVTVVNAQGGYLTIWPSGVVRPLVSSSNYQTGQNFNRHFTTGLGVDGRFNLYASATTDLVIDVAGFFAP